MNWTLHEWPKKKAALMPTLSLGFARHGLAKMYLALPHANTEGFGFEKSDFCNVFAGDGEDSGKLWLKPDHNGTVKIKRLKRVTAFQIAPLLGVKIKEATEVVLIVKHPHGGCIVTLPQFARPSVLTGTVTGQSKAVAAAAPKPEPVTVVESRQETAPEPRKTINSAVIHISGSFLHFNDKKVLLTTTQKAVAGVLVASFGERVNSLELNGALKAVDTTGFVTPEIVRMACIGLRNSIKREGLALAVNEYKGTKQTAWELAPAS